MQKVVLGLSLGLVLACAPELRAGEGERCDEASPCGADLECYRGFCIPDDAPPGEPAPIVTESDRDGGSSELGSARDAGLASSADSAVATSSGPVTSASSATSTDGGRANDAGTARSSDVQAPTGQPSSDPIVTPAPVTMSDAAVKPMRDAGAAAQPAKPPATTPPPATPSTPPATTPVDAGPSVDATVVVIPDAAMPKLPKDCTLEDCCAEATRAMNNAGKGNANEGKGGGKKCGCEDPALLRTLTCSVGGVVGGVVGVLL